MNAYKTPRMEAVTEYVVNKSRFLCYAAPAGTEEEALAFLAKIRARHRDATHNCYAYVIGENSGIMRYSDDGEPSGTAGMPMMEVLKARGVVNCVCVVTRYFGGILLGAGGLVRAYSHSAALALDAAQVSVMEPTTRCMVEVPYPLWDKVNYALKKEPVLSENTEFSATVVTTLLVRTKDLPALLSMLEAVTDARAETLPEEELYYPWPENDCGE